MVEQLSAVGPVDVLVNNAGIFSSEYFFKLEDSVWLDYYQTNVMSMVRFCRTLMSGMPERNRGAIINIASEAGVKPLPQMIHYSMTKSANISISRGLAELTKGTVVRVNSLLPGPTYFDGLAKRLPYHHAIWHLFVLGGSVCHWIAVYYVVSLVGAERFRRLVTGQAAAVFELSDSTSR